MLKQGWSMSNLLILIILFSSLVGFSANQEIKVVSYNIRNYELFGNRSKSEDSKKAVVQTLAKIDPDIAVLYELRSLAALKDLLARLNRRGRRYVYYDLIQGYDKYQHIAVISKIQPAKVMHQESLTYTFKGEERTVLRGFSCLQFTSTSGYSFYLIGAHLKAKNQGKETWRIRESEVRCLRNVYQSILKDTGVDSNILVVGDFNDTQDSNPLKLVMNTRGSPRDWLYDLRPTDGNNLAWTHHWSRKDQLSRIDYMLGNTAILPELKDPEIYFPSNWETSSDHRALIIKIILKDQIKNQFMFNKYGVRTNIDLPEK